MQNDTLLNERDIDDVECVFEALRNRGWHITFAESCTAGLAAATFVGLPSASTVFDRSFVTYANEAKVDMVGVDPTDIERYGVVSEIVAGEMASGAAAAAHAEVGVGISGIAGPDGGSERKPVGMVCFGYYVKDSLSTETVYFGNIGRNAVRESSVRRVFAMLRRLLAEKD